MDRIRCYACGAESYYDMGTRIICVSCKNKMEVRIKELEEERNGAMEAWKGREVAINQSIDGIRKSNVRIKELEEGIEKHKSTPYTMGCLVIASKVSDRDEELYKLIQKGGEE